MDLGQFFLALQGSGRVVVPRSSPPAPGDLPRVLREFEAAVRADAPSGLPEPDFAAATWAVELLHAACRLFVYRDLPADAGEQLLAAPCPAALAASATHYSVDLALRQLPALLQLARGAAPGDPLVAALQALAIHWPLSSVGIPDLGRLDVAPLLADAGLRRYYVDRILRLRDGSRAAEPAVAVAIAAAVGGHRELARGVLPDADSDHASA